METTDCAQCGAMAEVMCIFRRPNESGPIVRRVSYCLNGHELDCPTT